MNRASFHRAAKIICVAVIALAGPSLVEAAGITVEGPAEVIDGRTLRVDGRRIRLFGIDVPDLEQSCRWRKKTYPCGQISGDALRDLVTGATVICRLADTTPEMPLGLCSAEGFDIGGNMIYTGWAVAGPNASQRYRTTQAEARAAGRGLWRGEFVQPAAWRAGQRLAQ